MSSSINQSDLESFLNGKLSIEQAFGKVNSSIKEDGENEARDAKIMAGILDDLFGTSQSGMFRRSRKTSWTYFEDFGLMFDLKLSGNQNQRLAYYSNGGESVIGFASATTSKDNTSKKDKENEEAEKELEENLESLIDMAKESLVTYGRTLRSVKSEEVIILNINFGALISKSKLPKYIRLQVSKAQIEAYARGQKSIEQIKKEIDTKRLKASLSDKPALIRGYANQAQSIYSTPTSQKRAIVNGYGKKQ